MSSFTTNRLTDCSQGLGHLVSIPTGGDYFVACGQSRLGDIYAHAPPGTRDEPNFAHVLFPCINDRVPLPVVVACPSP
jgi:hypothetical protein